MGYNYMLVHISSNKETNLRRENFLNMTDKIKVNIHSTQVNGCAFNECGWTTLIFAWGNSQIKEFATQGANSFL